MNPEIATLIAQAENTKEILEQNVSFYNEFKSTDFVKHNKSVAPAIVFSQIFIDFYTCIETFLFRVSQTFENNLESEQWHKSLLHKMSLNIENIRPAVIPEKTFQWLDELLRFRHFRRYYFNFNYDWDKIELIEKKYNAAFPSVVEDINTFTKFLHKLK